MKFNEVLESIIEKDKSKHLSNNDFYLADHVNFIASETYSLIYDGNGNLSGTVPSDVQEYEHNKNVILFGNTNDLKKDGFAFAGWNTKPDGTGISYVAGDILM